MDQTDVKRQQENRIGGSGGGGSGVTETKAK